MGNFEKTPKRYQDPVLWVWLGNIFFLKSAIPKKYSESSRCGLLEAEHPNRYQTLKGGQAPPVLFTWEFPRFVTCLEGS